MKQLTAAAAIDDNPCEEVEGEEGDSSHDHGDDEDDTFFDWNDFQFEQQALQNPPPSSRSETPSMEE